MFNLYKVPKVNPPTGPNLYDDYLFEFNELIRLYVFQKWKILEYFFSRNKLSSFLRFCKVLFDLFKRIRKKTKRPSIIKHHLMNLAVILDNMYFYDIVLGKIEKEDINRLKSCV